MIVLASDSEPLRYAVLIEVPPGAEDDEPVVQGMKPDVIWQWHRHVERAGLAPIGEPTATLHAGPGEWRGWHTTDGHTYYVGKAWRVEGEVTAAEHNG